jgi:hypothetical protein
MSTIATSLPQDPTDDELDDEQGAPEPEALSQPQGSTAHGKTAADDKTGRRPRRASGAKRAVERALAVTHLDRRQRELLSRVLGEKGYNDSDEAIVRLVLSSLEPSSQAGQALSQLAHIAKSDPLEAGVAAMELASDRGFLTAAWAALSFLGVANSSSAPGTTAKAGLALAKAAQSLPQPAMTDLKKLLAVIAD